MRAIEDATALPSEPLQARYAELATEHRAAIARRAATALGSKAYIEEQRACAEIEVEMNLISGVLAERAGRGHVAVPGRV